MELECMNEVFDEFFDGIIPLVGVAVEYFSWKGAHLRNRNKYKNNNKRIIIMMIMERGASQCRKK